jgi:hypothetical protein
MPHAGSPQGAALLGEIGHNVNQCQAWRDSSLTRELPC